MPKFLFSIGMLNGFCFFIEVDPELFCFYSGFLYFGGLRDYYGKQLLFL
jgi:hypothetical protein